MGVSTVQERLNFCFIWTRITLGDPLFWFISGWKMWETRYIFNCKSDRARCQFCFHMSKSCFCLSSIAEEPVKLFLFTGSFYPLLVLSWNCFIFNHLNSCRVIDLWISPYRSLPNRYLFLPPFLLSTFLLTFSNYFSL